MADWTFDELLPNGWHPHWSPLESEEAPYSLEFTYYRSEIARHSVEAQGSTEREAIESVVAAANAWLRDHPEYAPKRPPASRS